MVTSIQLIHQIPAFINTHDTGAIEKSFSAHEESHWSTNWMVCGNSYERCAFRLMGYVVYMQTYFPFNWLKETKVTYYLDLMVKENVGEIDIAKRFNAELSDYLIYTDDINDRIPVFKEVTDIINYLKFKTQN